MAYRDVIIDAIKRRQILEIEYKHVVRTVHPHILGFVGDGELALSGWQLSGTGAGWRLFHVADIAQLVQTGRSFHRTGPGYNPDDPAFSRIVKRV